MLPPMSTSTPVQWLHLTAACITLLRHVKAGLTWGANQPTPMLDSSRSLRLRRRPNVESRWAHQLTGSR